VFTRPLNRGSSRTLKGMRMQQPQLPHNREQSAGLRRRRNITLAGAVVLSAPLMFLAPPAHLMALLYVYFGLTMVAAGYYEYRGLKVFLRDLRERAERNQHPS